jgi:hypothetical protein
MADTDDIPVGATLGGTVYDHRRLAQLATRPDDPRVRAHLSTALWLGRLDEHRGHRDLPDVIATLRAHTDCDVQLLAEQRPLPTFAQLTADLETLVTRGRRPCDRPLAEAIARNYLAQRGNHHAGHRHAWDHATDMLGLDEVDGPGEAFGEAVAATAVSAWRRTVPAVAWGSARRQLLYARNLTVLADGALLAADVPASVSYEPSFAATPVGGDVAARLASDPHEASLLANLLDLDDSGAGQADFDAAVHICRQLTTLR